MGLGLGLDLASFLCGLRWITNSPLAWTRGVDRNVGKCLRPPWRGLWSVGRRRALIRPLSLPRVTFTALLTVDPSLPMLAQRSTSARTFDTKRLEPAMLALLWPVAAIRALMSDAVVITYPRSPCSVRFAIVARGPILAVLAKRPPTALLAAVAHLTVRADSRSATLLAGAFLALVLADTHRASGAYGLFTKRLLSSVLAMDLPLLRPAAPPLETGLIRRLEKKLALIFWVPMLTVFHPRLDPPSFEPPTLKGYLL